MKKKWTSNAEWPDSIRLGCTTNASKDYHDSKEFAEAICRRLEREGFGGGGTIFPIRTWVEEIEVEDKIQAPGRTLASTILMGMAAGVDMPGLLTRLVGRAKTKKKMGPGVGTNRMRRAKTYGKGW